MARSYQLDVHVSILPKAFGFVIERTTPWSVYDVFCVPSS